MYRVYFKLLIPFIKCKVPSYDEAKQIVERVIAKFDNSIDFDAKLDLGLDPDAKDFVSKKGKTHRYIFILHETLPLLLIISQYKYI